jgi:hypothetical protein
MLGGNHCRQQAIGKMGAIFQDLESLAQVTLSAGLRRVQTQDPSQWRW